MFVYRVSKGDYKMRFVLEQVPADEGKVKITTNQLIINNYIFTHNYKMELEHI